VRNYNHYSLLKDKVGTIEIIIRESRFRWVGHDVLGMEELPRQSTVETGRSKVKSWNVNEKLERHYTLRPKSHRYELGKEAQDVSRVDWC